MLIERSENLKAAFIMAKLAGQLEQAFIGFDAAVAEEALSGTNETDQRLRQPALRLVVIEIRGVNELARLLNQRLGNGRVRVAEAAHCDAAAEVQVPLAGDIEQVTARAVAEHEVEAPVTGHHVLPVQRLDGRHIVAHDGRR